MISHNEETESLVKDAERVFSVVFNGLTGYSSIIKAIPKCGIVVCSDRAKIAGIKRLPGDSQGFVIKLSEDFLENLRKTLYSHEPQVRGVVSLSTRSDFIPQDHDISPILECIYDLALQFVLHHELFHLSLGHLDFLKIRQNSFSLNETQELDFSDSEKQETDFVLELEADGTALIWLYYELCFDSLNQLLVDLGLSDTANDSRISDLTGDAKIFATKLLFIAFWLVLAKVEERREKLHGTTEVFSHPLPSIRISTCALTLIQHYAQIRTTHETDIGLVTHIDDNEANYISGFINDILHPFALHFRDFPNAAQTTDTNVDNHNFNKDNSALKIIQSFTSYLSTDSEETDLHQAFTSLEKRRAELNKQLEPFRYLKEIVL